MPGNINKRNAEIGYKTRAVTIHWTGLLDWNTGLDYWTEVFSFFGQIFMFLINIDYSKWMFNRSPATGTCWMSI